MGATTWTTDDLLWLVQAWSGAPQPPHFGEKQDANAMHAFSADPGIYSRFMALSGGPTKRSAASVRTRTEVVLYSHAFIRAFHADREWSEGRNWFSLSVGEQRARTRTAGSRQVQLIDAKVFAAVDAFFGKKDTSLAAVAPETAAVAPNTASAAPKASMEDEQSPEEESDAPDLKEEKVMSSSDDGKDEGDSDGRGQKPYPKFRGSWISREESSQHSSDSESESEEEAQPPAEEEEEEEEERVATKRRRVSSDADLEQILARQSRSLANFLSERASERSRERELSRQEREADRRFWTKERAKDRALLRELFARRGRR